MVHHSLSYDLPFTQILKIGQKMSYRMDAISIIAPPEMAPLMESTAAPEMALHRAP